MEEVRKKLAASAKAGLIDNFDKMTGFDTIKLDPDECFSYPKTEKSEGYDWFVKNHKGVKTRDRSQVIGMPNARNDMKFMEYLEAMEPRVKPVGGPAGGDRGFGNNQGGHWNNRNNNRNNKRGNTNNRSSSQRNQNNRNVSSVETGLVQPYKNPNIVKFKIGQGKPKSIQCRKMGLSPEEAQKKYPEGSEIKVIFRGKNEATGFEEYDIVEE